MTALYMFLAAILVLMPLVALHEWGHYIVARLCGVKVLTYSIGFGARLFGWTSKKTGIDYRICAIPLGGYVRMLDEKEGNVAEHEKHLAFNNQHPLKKIAIVVAGPVMNFLIAIVLFFILFLQPSEQLNTKIGRVFESSFAAQNATLAAGDKIVAIDGNQVQTWEQVNYQLVKRMGETGVLSVRTQSASKDSEHAIYIERFMQGEQKGLDPLTALGIAPWQPVVPAVIGRLTPDGAAALMGLQVGDKIVAIDGVPMDDWLMATQVIQKSPEKMLTFSVLRQGKPIQLPIMPRAVKTQGRVIGQIGAAALPTKVEVPSDYRLLVQYTPQQALNKAVAKTYELSKMTLVSMGKMITGLIGLDNLSGPISIAQVSKDSFMMGWAQVLSTAALISLSLAVLNLLPIPVLDGGHLLFYIYELLVGKPMSEAVQMTGFKAGFVLLFCLMVLAIGNDIMRLFG